MPNWVANVVIVRPDQAKKLEELFSEREDDKSEYFDFEKIIPMPATVYQGSSGFGSNWHPAEMTLEEYQTKYPDGDWYKWSIANWGTKWNACDSEYHPPEGDCNYGILSFNTAWSLPVPIYEAMHQEKKLEFQLYFTEESDAFLGAVPYTDDKDHPYYLDDPDGTKDPDAIYELVNGGTQYGWLYDDEGEILSWIINSLKSLKAAFSEARDDKTGNDGSRVPMLKEGNTFREYIAHVVSLYLIEREELEFTEAVRKEIDMREKLKDELVWEVYSIDNHDRTLHKVFQEINDRIAEIRMKSFTADVGYTMDDCDKVIQREIAFHQLHQNQFMEIDKNVGVYSVTGKRILFRALLSRASYENVRYKVERMINYRKPTWQQTHDAKMWHFNGTDKRPNPLIDTAEAMVELYDEIPTMSTEEFLRMINVYIRTNLFHIDDEQMSDPNEQEIADLRRVLSRINVVLFKSMIHTGLIGRDFIDRDAINIKLGA